jgi:hypothetical protein
MTRRSPPAPILAFGISAVAVLGAGLAFAAARPSDAQLIASAASAAPAAIGHQATVIATDGAGRMRPLRRGGNGWTCIPDDPSTPGTDPMCVDRNGMAWMEAMRAHRPPPAATGFAYMLQGGSDASNTDPYATKAAVGAWVKTGPHVMVLSRAVAAASGFPGGPHPDTSRPYVMFAGTPYAHIMMPVR